MSDDKNFDPWSNPPPPKKKPKPPGNPTPPGQRPDPELDEVLKRLQQNTRNFFGGDGNNKRLLLMVILFVFLLWLSIGSMFFVAAGEKAVVLRFGKYDRTVGNGLNFKFPPPFETKFVRNVDSTERVSIGEGADENLMVTGDENIVDVEFIVRWKREKSRRFSIQCRRSGFNRKKSG